MPVGPRASLEAHDHSINCLPRKWKTVDYQTAERAPAWTAVPDQPPVTRPCNGVQRNATYLAFCRMLRSGQGPDTRDTSNQISTYCHLTVTGARRVTKCYSVTVSRAQQV